MSVSAATIQALIEEATGRRSDPAGAEASLREAARMAGDGKLRRLEASALYELGCVVRRGGPARDEEALGHLHRSLELCVEAGDMHRQVAVLRELGLHSFQSSDLPDALSFLHEAEQLCKLHGMHPELADVVDTLGGVYYTMGQYETSLEYDRQELEIAARLRDGRIRIHALDALASTESALGDHESAMAHFEECLHDIAGLEEGRERQFLQGVVFADWAEALCAAQRWSQAREKAEQSATLANSLQNAGLEGQALYALGRALVGQGLEQEAEESLLRAHGLYRSVRNKFYRGKIERELSGICRRRGDFRRALEFLEMALATDASMQREAAMHASAQQRARERIEGLKRDKVATERVLFNVLPDAIARKILAGAPRIAEERADVSVLFADVVGFTELASRTDASDLLEMLDRIFSRFDALTQEHGLAKIKTIGDAYMAAGGVPESSADHLERCARLALALRDSLGELNRHDGSALALRIGLHVGPAVAGVIGSARLSYDLWGETVNLASRLESSGLPGRIQVSAQVRQRLQSDFSFRSRGSVSLKGVGEVETWFLDGPLV